VKALLQRVSSARVRVRDPVPGQFPGKLSGQVPGQIVGEIGPGLLVFLGVLRGDGASQAERLAERTAEFRCFGDERERMNLSLLQVGGSALVVSQFTLAHADSPGSRRGRRPSFDLAASPPEAEALYLRFVEVLRSLGVPTSTGSFAARMEVELVNDGPVTFLLEESAPEPAT
jgi:D-aminoacyl-tRNA deacylase